MKTLKTWQKIFIALCGAGLLFSILLALPIIHKLVFDFVENQYVHRPLVREVWSWRFIRHGYKLALLFIALGISFLRKYEIIKSSKTVFIYIAIAASFTVFVKILSTHCTSYMIGLCFYSILFFLVLYIAQLKNSPFFSSFESIDEKFKKKSFCFFLILTVLASTFPIYQNSLKDKRMAFGIHEKVECTNQYEELANAILNGHLYIDDGNISQKLLEMENPYDPSERAKANVESNVDYEWDHAFYNGHYYMYFGVAPVFLLFIPYQLIFNSPFPTYWATLIFTALVIIGIFVLFYIFVSNYCRKITWGAFIFLCAALSIMSSWYFIYQPALYCTAISSGVCFAVWGFILLFQAFVLDSENSKHHYLKIFFGAFCSALIFACRPPIGVFCLVYVPMILDYIIKNKQKVLKILTSAIFFAVPFIVVASLLMMYNEARFDNPFEFGQSYQLTAAYQVNILKDNLNFFTIIGRIFGTLIAYEGSVNFLPIHLGTIITFPITLIAFLGFKTKNFKELKAIKLDKLYILLFALILFTIILDVLWSPVIMMRYTMDYHFMFSILIMIVFCVKFNTMSEDETKTETFRAGLLSFITIIAPLYLI